MLNYLSRMYNSPGIKEKGSSFSKQFRGECDYFARVAWANLIKTRFFSYYVRT